MEIVKDANITMKRILHSALTALTEVTDSYIWKGMLYLMSVSVIQALLELLDSIQFALMLMNV